MPRTENLHIREIVPLITPDDLKAQLPLGEDASRVVSEARAAIQNMLHREDARMLAIVGPCSIHDRKGAIEYARRLKTLSDEVADRVLIVMRAYFEKPRTTIGWKGLLYDPDLDGTDDIERGFHLAREILLEIAAIGLPAATEILDPIVPQYLADLIAWAAIGARTTESQIHRQMASGLSMPIGFKNATDGNLTIAVDAIRAAAQPHAFLGITSQGRAGIATTNGNPYTHIVMRGGAGGPNYQSEYVAFTEVLLRKAGLPAALLVDCSHANSEKNPTRQAEVLADVIDQRRQGNRSIFGVMLESYLHEGAQKVGDDPSKLRYGVSVTDACCGWEDTERMIRLLAQAV